MSNSRIVVCTVCYSDNLGDGVIAQTVEYLLTELGQTEIVHYDISGRTTWPSQVKAQSLQKQIFLKSPSWLRPWITRVGFLTQFKPKLKQNLGKLALKKSDRVIIAGGQLLSDVALNFPLKLEALQIYCESVGCPYWIVGVGVGANMSKTGLNKLSRLVSNAQSPVYVRDSASADRLAQWKTGQVIKVSADPGLWAGDCFQIKSQPIVKDRALIGVGIAHPGEIKAHMHERDDSNVSDNLTVACQQWCNRLRALLDSGYQLELFTNGSCDDNEFLSQVVNQFDARLQKEVQVLPTATRPVELAQKISRYQGIVAHRLHAHIVAHSLGIPSIALLWDGKLAAYMNMIGRSHWGINEHVAPETIAVQLKQAMQEGLDKSRIQSMRSKSKSALADVFSLQKN